MPRCVLFAPADQVIDNSLDARNYVERLARSADLERRGFPEDHQVSVPEGADSIAVLSGLSSLELSSGYMEMELDTIFEPQELLGDLRRALPGDYPVVAVVDDAFSDYIMKSYLKAGASAVVGTSGDLFGLVTLRLRSWDDLLPYINVFRSV